MRWIYPLIYRYSLLLIWCVESVQLRGLQGSPQLALQALGLGWFNWWNLIWEPIYALLVDRGNSLGDRFLGRRSSQLGFYRRGQIRLISTASSDISLSATADYQVAAVHDQQPMRFPNLESEAIFTKLASCKHSLERRILKILFNPPSSM